MLDLSVPDWRERIRAGRSLLPPLPLDEELARKAVGAFNLLRIPDVPDRPPMSEAAGDWFREIVAALFGSVHNGERLIREILLLVAKKNSKTTGGAGLMMTALIRNMRPRAEFLMVGPTQDVAKLAFSQAVGMIESDPQGFLQKRFKPRETSREIYDHETKSVLKIKSFDSSVLTGIKPAGVLLDELHEIAKSADASRVLGQIRGGMIPNPEAFLVMITTQSDQPPVGVWADELKKARAIRDGRARGRMLPVLYEFPEDIARAGAAGEPPPWYDSRHWWMVTPNRDRSVKIARLEEEFETAKLVGTAEVARWASQHLNIEIGVGLRADRWRGADYWQSSIDPALTWETLLERSEVVVVGIDGGGHDDLFGFAALGRERETRRWLLWTRAWALHQVLSIRQSAAAQMSDLERAGELVLVDNMEDAFVDAALLCAEIDAAGLLARVGLDPFGVGAVVDALAEQGIEGDRVIGISQGWQMSGSIKTAEIKLANGTMWHADQGLMRWCVGNAKVEPKGNAVTITKQVAGAGKIDPLIATLCAVALMSRNPEAAPVLEIAAMVA